MFGKSLTISVYLRAVVYNNYRQLNDNLQISFGMGALLVDCR